MDNPGLYQIMTQSVIRWKIERIILHKFNASLQPSVQFQFIHRMRLILNIISRRCIIYGWPCNVNDTPRNSRAQFRLNKKYDDGVEEGTSFFLPRTRRWNEVIGVSPFAARNTGTWKRESTSIYTIE